MSVKKTTWCQIPEHLRMFLGNHPHMLPKMRISTTDDLLKLGTIFHLDHCESKVENSWSRCYLEDFRSTGLKARCFFVFHLSVREVYWGGGLHWGGFSFIILNMWILHRAQDIQQSANISCGGQVWGGWFNAFHSKKRTINAQVGTCLFNTNYRGAPVRTDWNTSP